MLKSSKVANDRSKMHEKADLREANLNGAILADAKLGGARLDEGFYCATYTALVTTSDVTPFSRHFAALVCYFAINLVIPGTPSCRDKHARDIARG
jgi:Pentapeptide repeats (8 copies)